MIQIILPFFIFAFIHSVTASGWFKRLCTGLLGETFMRVWYRFLYNAVSVVTVLTMFYLIAKAPDTVIWIPPAWLRWTMRGIQIAGLVFGGRAFEHMDAGEFMGFRQVRRYLMRGEAAGNIEGLAEKELVITGVYGIVRHPLYLAGLVIVTCNPVITINDLTFSVLADLYFLFGMFIEERRFLKIFGDQYREYMKQVPRLMPRFSRRKTRLGKPGK